MLKRPPGTSGPATGRYLFSFLCLVVGACGGSDGGPSPQPAPAPLNGSFGGGGSATSSLGTEARTSVSIQITNNVITTLSIPWRTAPPPGTPAGASCGGSTSSSNLTLSPGSSAFSFTIDSSQYLTQVTGNAAEDMVRGVLTVTAHTENVPPYCGSATIPWTATKGAAATPLQ